MLSDVNGRATKYRSKIPVPHCLPLSDSLAQGNFPEGGDGLSGQFPRVNYPVRIFGEAESYCGGI